ncbi:hypothetical protein [Saccharopolyspora hordei]|uniref:Uncharacterized protein n=1 Tax=Saccharopolyspora hordei TaxID=1838 RepID=A0A853AGI3_9PSEU|nr:hypothetical protein [Saccharopolyspora hordei]NYI83694.1 hypothetical protein [Saccharopolyspora hordei]
MIEVLAARASWCAPEEKILWCHPLTSRGGTGKYIQYAVPGLNEFGEPRKLSRAALEAATGAASLFFEALLSQGETGETASDSEVPWAVVAGKARDCLAVSHLADWQANGGNSAGFRDRKLFWVLTTHRLGLLDFTPRDSGEGSNSSGLLGGLKKTIGSVWDREEEQPANRELELPVPLVCAEVPRNAIASVEVVEQKVKGWKRNWFKVVLSDGSAFFISHRKHNEKRFFDRMLAMTYGQE